MMESSQRPHHHHHRSNNTTTTNELFICFTSRLSSSSMKISSKSILSPARPRDSTPVSLSTSLSRRLRTNGSIKGAQSPMFPKKRGGTFENPEPSSPKVTCIGQVRVKTKKQGKKIRTLSNRRGGEVSFRKIEQKSEVGFQQDRNQRWVHLPLTICEALRGIGAEFSCLFPCFSNGEREKEEEKGRELREENHGGGDSSCGAVFGRWLVAVQGREIELVVGGEEEEEERRTERGERNLSLRRHVDAVEEGEVKDEECGVVEGGGDGAGEEEEGRVSTCIPPKNALWLMRCRSDPIRMSALANRFWESPARNGEEEEDEEDEDGDGEEGNHDVEGELLEIDARLREDEEIEGFEKLVSAEDIEEEEEEEENPEAELHGLVMEGGEAEERGNPGENLEKNEELEEEDEEKQLLELLFESLVQEVMLSAEAEENEENAVNLIQEGGGEEGETRLSHHSPSSVSVDSDSEEEAAVEEEAAAEEKSTGERETQLKEKVTQRRSESEETHIEEGEGMESEERETESHGKVERESEVKKVQDRERRSVLPDCLLLMMCEPKLSMEVSKETWVCSTDFIRRLPERPPVSKVDGGDEPKKRSGIDSNPVGNAGLHQKPPRSLPPAAVSMAAMIEEKLGNAMAYEPFVLTRCKSEPMRMRKAAAKLAPETCFWKNRKLEPLRRATFGVGAAGVGF